MFEARLATQKVVEYAELVRSLADFASLNPFHLVDARSAGRFAGTAQEPRGLPSGHGSSNVTKVVY